MCLGACAEEQGSAGRCTSAGTCVPAAVMYATSVLSPHAKALSRCRVLVGKSFLREQLQYWSSAKSIGVGEFVSVCLQRDQSFLFQVFLVLLCSRWYVSSFASVASLCPILTMWFHTSSTWAIDRAVACNPPLASSLHVPQNSAPVLSSAVVEHGLSRAGAGQYLFFVIASTIGP